MTLRNSLIPRPILVSGLLLGLGMGGLFDGIVLHQILQWHHMLTSAGYPANSVENLQLNTLADGFFHAAAWLLTAIGLFVFWRAVQRKQLVYSPTALSGAFLMGWGLFNLVEGIVNHHILGIHHVRSGPDELLWDLAFLAWGALMFAGGWWMIRRFQRRNLSENISA